MSQDIHQTAYLVGNFFVSDIYAYYQDTYKGVLGKVQVEALDYIHRSEKASIKELATVLNISKQHASKIAGKLEELGYARKEKDPNDGRGTLYALTETGSRFINEHISISFFKYLFQSSAGGNHSGSERSVSLLQFQNRYTVTAF